MSTASAFTDCAQSSVVTQRPLMVLCNFSAENQHEKQKHVGRCLVRFLVEAGLSRESCLLFQLTKNVGRRPSHFVFSTQNAEKVFPFVRIPICSRKSCKAFSAILPICSNSHFFASVLYVQQRYMTLSDRILIQESSKNTSEINI